MTNTPQHNKTNLQEVITRNLNAREILALACSHPMLSEVEREIDAALRDAAILAVELVELRLNLAHLAAAARATLKAHADGDSDPLWFLRDELTAQGWTGRGRA